MVKAFKIYKEGKTILPITILIPLENFTDELLNSKINFYKSLGYTIEII